MRNNYEDLPTAQWTEAEAMHHLTGTFDRVARTWPDIMEPYVIELADSQNPKEVMRRALRETVNKRYGGECGQDQNRD